MQISINKIRVLKSCHSWPITKILQLLGFRLVQVLVGQLQPFLAHHKAPEEAGHERNKHDVKTLELWRIEVQHWKHCAHDREEGVYTRDEGVIYGRRRRENFHSTDNWKYAILVRHW